MNTRFCIFSLLLAGAAMSMHAQLSLPIKTINNTQYYYYTVKKKETLYGVSNQLGITQNDIIKYNPSTKNGLKEKQILFFPVSAFQAKSAANSSKSTTKEIAQITHVVNKGETLYGLAKLYNVSIEQIVAANPETNEGLKAGQTVVIPQPQNIKITKTNTSASATQPEVQQPANQQIIYHKIKQGETLYSVSRTYNTTIESILELNQGISASNFKYDEVIKVQPNLAKPIIVEKNVTEFHTYVAKKDDTFYSIAQENGIDVESLQAANPDIKKLKKGTVVNIPLPRTEKVAVDPSEASESTPVARVERHPDTMNVAIIMPFMLNQSTPSVSAKNNTEFYKGFMLAVDSVRKSTKKHINVYAYDNRASLSVTDSILSTPELSQMNMIIAPPDAKQLAAINKFCKENSIIAMNALSVKDEEFSNNPFAVQLNIPPTYLSAEIFDWFDKQFAKHQAIIINDAANETKDFYQELKQHLSDKKVVTTTVNIDADFSYSSLSDRMNPGTKYVIIPSSSSKETLTRIMPILKHIKQERIDIDISLLGYPEYCAYLLEYQSDFHKVDTYIYSRFFYDSTSSRTKAVEANYQRWYGEEMRFTVPRMGLLGFDSGMFMLNLLGKQGPDAFASRHLPQHNGLQSSFKLERISNWSGFINKDLQFIHFTPYSTIEKM